ncbi:MAG TPA: hypothetical protein VFE51_00100 [Verrucomicrobiae bacterium]|nr:hypothetical protein [Verrucomicrobiae bacterium]
MTDLELLFLVLGIIYVWECGWWAKSGTVGFRTWLGKRWQITMPSRLLGNQQGGVILAPPFPPLGTLLASHSFPLSISLDGVLAYVPPSIDPARRGAQSGQFFSFEEIRSVEAAAKKVRINGKLLLTAASPVSAASLAAIIDRLRKLPATERRRAIEREIESSFDIKELKGRWNEFRSETRGLRLNANLLFLYLFAIIPLALWRFGLSFAWPWLLAGLLACTLTIALRFHRAHKRFFPEAEDERFTHFIILLLSPASTVRARDLLTRPLLERFHPVAIAQVLGSAPAFEQLAAQFLRELRFPALPLCPRSEPIAQATERHSREFLLRALEAFLKRNGCRPEKLLRPPLRSDPHSRSYCPRCHSQFTVLEGSCQDCGGITLSPFEPQVPLPGKSRERSRPVTPNQRSV